MSNVDTRTRTEYTLLTSSAASISEAAQHLANLVGDLVAAGWELYGDPMLSTTPGTGAQDASGEEDWVYLAQAVIRTVRVQEG